MRKTALDILKFISAILIVTIHIMFPGNLGVFFKAFSRFAVPVFFMVSGYFSYNAIENRNYLKLRNRIVKLLKIYIPSAILYFVVELLIRDRSIWFDYIKESICLSSLIKLILFNKPLFNTPLWFLLALIYCYLLIMLLLKFNKLKVMEVLTPILLVVSILFFDIILGVINIEISQLIVRNFLLMGMPFVCIGYFLKMNENRLSGINNLALLSTLILGFAVFIIEYLFLYNMSELYFGSSIIAVSLFILCIRDNRQQKSNKFFAYISDASLTIYIVHSPLSNVCNKLIDKTGMNRTVAFEYIYPIVIILLSIIISFFIYVVKSHINVNKNKSKAI